MNKPNNEQKADTAPMPWFFALFIFLLVLFPLPFGGNRPWASDLFAVATGLLLAFTLWKQRERPIVLGPQSPRKSILFAIAGVSAVIFWTFLQTAPWMPQPWHHPVWEEAAGILGKTRGAISIDPSVFPESLLRLVSYAACFLISFYGARNPSHARYLVRSIGLAGVAYATYGLFVQSLGADTILWYKKWAYIGFLTSTFVNKNSYAVYAGLGLLCLLATLRRHFREKKIVDTVLARRARILALITSMEFIDYVFIGGAMALLAALALTGSRGGIGATVCGIGIFYVAMAINKKFRSTRWLWIAGGCLITLAAFVTMGGQALVARMDPQTFGADAQTRLAAYKLEAMAISDNPWLGFGLGTFEPAFRLYRDTSLPLWFHHAHNDYFEMIMDLGLPAALVLFASLAALIGCCLSAVWKRGRDADYAAIALGASALMAVHACIDFSFHIPAIAATYASLLGAGVAQSWTTRDT